MPVPVAGVPGGPRRLLFLDALRGMAALWVVLAHDMATLTEAGALHGWQLWLARVTDDPLDLGKAAVVLFFLISGFIIPNSLGPPSPGPPSLNAAWNRVRRFCISRFFRLYPVYWLAVATAVAWGVLGLSPSFPPAAVLVNLSMVQGFLAWPDVIGASWTLEIELVFYAICLLLAVTHRIASTRSCTLASLAFLAVAVVLAGVRFVVIRKLPVALPLALSLMFFGTVWRHAVLDNSPLARRVAPLLLLVLSVGIVVASLLAYNHDYGFGEHWDRYVLSYAAGIAAFVAGTTRVRVTWRPVVWLGEISYALYLFHILARDLVHRLGFVPGAWSTGPAFYLGATVCAALGLAWLVTVLVERPAIAVGHRLMRSGHPAPDGRASAPEGSGRPAVRSRRAT